MSKDCFIVHTGWGYEVFTTKKGALDYVFGTARKVVETSQWSVEPITHTRSSAERELREGRQVTLFSDVLITPSSLWNRNERLQLDIDASNLEFMEALE